MKKKLNNFFLEAGINHFGKMSYAKKMLNFFLNSSYQNISFMIQSEKFYKKFIKKGINFNLAKNFYFEAIKSCRKRKKKFGLAVCDASSFKEKKDLNVDFYKLLSVGIYDYDLIEMLKIKKKPVYISTGFNVSEKEIKKCIKLFNNNKNIQLLHAPMTYKPAELNLKTIDLYKRKFKLPTGYSNHFNKKEIFYSLLPYNPNTIFLYCKPVKKKGRVYPDDQHAFYLNELENIISNYNFISKISSFHDKKKMKVTIFKNEIKL